MYINLKWIGGITMSNKYKVLVIAYKNVDKKILDKISRYSIKTIDSADDMENVSTFCSRGFNMNDRICIYLGWFKDEAKEKLKEGYEISILELPHKISDNKVEVIEFLDAAYEDDLLVIGKVDV